MLKVNSQSVIALLFYSSTVLVWSSPLFLPSFSSLLIFISAFVCFIFFGRTLLASRNFLVIFFIGLFVISLLLISWFWTPSSNYGLQKVIRFSVLMLPIFIILLMSERSLEYLYVCNFIFCFFFLALLYLYAGENFFESISKYSRIGDEEFNPIIVGKVAGFILLIIIAKGSSFLLLSLGRFFLILLLLAVVIFSGSKGVLLAVSSAVLVFYPKYLKLMLPVVVLFLVFSLHYFSMIYELFENRFLNPGGSISSRLINYGMALDAWGENPIFGLGVGGFSFYSTGMDYMHYPHNIILEVAAEFGLVGLSLFIIFISLVFFSIFVILKKNSDIDRLFAAFFLYSFILAQFTNDLAGNYMVFMMGAKLIMDSRITKINTLSLKRSITLNSRIHG